MCGYATLWNVLFKTCRVQALSEANPGLFKGQYRSAQDSCGGGRSSAEGAKMEAPKDICWIGDKKSHLKHVLRACKVQISNFEVFQGNAAKYLRCGG